MAAPPPPPTRWKPGSRAPLAFQTRPAWHRAMCNEADRRIELRLPRQDIHELRVPLRFPEERADIASHHDRQVMIDPADWRAWRDGSAWPADLCRPAPAGTLTVIRVDGTPAPPGG